MFKVEVMVHMYWVQPAVKPALVDIRNTWDNADTAVAGNTPAFHPENEPVIRLPEAATPSSIPLMHSLARK